MTWRKSTGITLTGNEFTNTIASAIAASGLPYREVATRAGVGHDTISRLCTGRNTNLLFANLQAIAKVVGLKIKIVPYE